MIFFALKFNFSVLCDSSCYNSDMNRADTFINYIIDLEATGKNIRTFMKITGYTARELEKLMGCTQMAFFNWQEGKNLPSYDNLLRLAGILKAPLEKIVVFKKFTEEDLPLKDTNTGFVRNNVFFTYNRATECVVRDCLVFKKKYGCYPDQMIFSPKTLDNWKKRENEESCVDFPESELTSVVDSVSGEIIIDDVGNQSVKTMEFSLKLVLKEDMPENYYRLLKTV